MADTDLIARLYSADDRDVHNAKYAIKMAANHARYVPSRVSREETPPPSESRYDRGTRAPTEPPEEQNGDLDKSPYLELRFSRGARTTRGFIFGTNEETCDIVLPYIPGISEHHCALTFEDDFKDVTVYRPVLRDLDSSAGPEFLRTSKKSSLKSSHALSSKSSSLPIT